MNPASTHERSLSHLECAGQIAGMWQSTLVVVRPFFAKNRKGYRVRRDEIVMG
ncbi:hypothetical protein OKA05_07615 [Luteolibacter arcticus]|uniref:Uncharacterized protein n=1 Tax=Luteolibacter arcticus TaxID=1581411 RepID=A0ABT3GFN1_9BACT|nr:hypothetical protein [Luteolibacter arcticus]MCW1922417.1 hypothetical protein [Luteolibacter arcticus]